MILLYYSIYIQNHIFTKERGIILSKKLTFEEKKAKVARFNIIDDVYFQKMVEDREVCEEIIRVIMDDDSIIVIENHPQEPQKNIAGRSVIMDALCKDATGRYFNVEVQKADNDNHVKRVRYIAACVTTNISETGKKFELVPDVVAIYISRFDMFDKGRILYRATMKLDGTFEDVDDGFEAYYVNTAVKEDSLLGELMDYFKNSEGEHPAFPNLSGRNMLFKTSQKEVGRMCEIMDMERAEGRVEERAENCKKMHEKGMSYDEIADLLDITSEDVKNALLLAEEGMKY